MGDEDGVRSCGDAERALLLAVRQVLISATRAIERYPGLGPARGARR